MTYALSDEERVAFLTAFDDEAAFRADIAGCTATGHDVASAHFASPRKFGFGPNPESDATTYRYTRFRALKPVFVVALETELRKMDLLNLQWSQVDLAQGFIRVQMQKTKKFAVVPISRLCREALDECRCRSVVSRYVFVPLTGDSANSWTRLHPDGRALCAWERGGGRGGAAGDGRT